MIRIYKRDLKPIFKTFFIALLFVFSSNVLLAQTNLQDVVYLKNGSVVRGIIIEQVPNESLKIQTADGSLFVYKIEEVDKITKEAPVGTKTKKPSAKKEKISSSDSKIKITPYFSVGVTAAVPSMEDLEYDYPDLYTRDVNPLAIGGGVQMLFAVNNIWLGFDIGAKKTFSSTANYDMSLIYSEGRSEQIDKETAINFIFLSEYQLPNHFFLQGGLGAYMTSWFYSYEYQNSEYGSSYTYVEYSDTHWNFGIMLAAGKDFAITENIAIPLFLKFDFMFRYGIMIPITLNTGVKISL